MPKRKFFLTHLSEVIVRTRGYLPHWELPGASYSLTFRLHGSLPKAVIDRLAEEQRVMERSITRGKRKLTAIENMDVRARLETRLDEALHASPTLAHMNDPRIALIVVNTLTHFAGDRYDLDAWCVMPNHVHAVLTPRETWNLWRIVKSWKTYSSGEANKVLRRCGRLWQRDYYDRILRDEQDFFETTQYIWENPRKAGLRDWPWIGCRL